MKNVFIYSLFFSWFVLVIPIAGFGQAKKDEAAAADPPKTPFEKSTGPRTRVDLNGVGFMDPLPFDVSFKIFGIAYDPDLLSVKCSLKEGELKTVIFSNADVFATWKNNVIQQVPFMVYCKEELKPNKDYIFKFEIQRKLNTEEQTYLKDLIAGRLLVFFNNKLRTKGNFELRRADVTILAADVLSVLTRNLQSKGYTVRSGRLRSNYYDLLATSLIEVSDLYEEVYHTPLELLVSQNSFFTNVVNILDNVIPAEAGFVASAKYINLARQLRTLLQATTINPDIPLPGADLANYLTTLEEALSNTSPSLAPASPNYKAIEDDLIDILKTLQNSLKAYLEAPKTAKPAVDAAAIRLADLLADIIYSDIIVGGETFGTYDARSSVYLSADIGVAVFPTIGKAAPYLGTNIYLRPVNKERPIYKGKYNPARCFSFLVGISIGSVSETNVRSDLFANSMNLLAGGGYRVTDHIRLNGGFVFYKGLEQNPLLTSKKVGINGFFSLSFDWDINSTFRSIFSPSFKISND